MYKPSQTTLKSVKPNFRIPLKNRNLKRLENICNNLLLPRSQYKIISTWKTCFEEAQRRNLDDSTFSILDVGIRKIWAREKRRTSVKKKRKRVFWETHPSVCELRPGWGRGWRIPRSSAWRGAGAPIWAGASCVHVFVAPDRQTQLIFWHKILFHFAQSHTITKTIENHFSNFFLQILQLGEIHPSRFNSRSISLTDDERLWEKNARQFDSSAGLAASRRVFLRQILPGEHRAVGWRAAVCKPQEPTAIFNNNDEKFAPSVNATLLAKVTTGCAGCNCRFTTGVDADGQACLPKLPESRRK